MRDRGAFAFLPTRTDICALRLRIAHIHHPRQRIAIDRWRWPGRVLLETKPIRLALLAADVLLSIIALLAAMYRCVIVLYASFDIYLFSAQ